ncbi:MAG: sugar phosphate isomerase/epimerase family protein [Cyclobacteriaceae bacterium]
MNINRRTFLNNSALLSSGLFLNDDANQPSEFRPTFTIPSNFSLQIFATNWGFNGSADDFCAKAKEAGYDGIEVWLPNGEKAQEELFSALDQHQLAYGFLAAGGDSQFEKHQSQFQQSVEATAKHRPAFINCHSGRDYFSFEQNRQLIEFTTEVSESSGIPIYHETHRGRMLFAAHIAREFLQADPELELTLDISHWCNVHESLLQDQEETVQLALERSGHVHSRIGHAESPQVTDPRAPEWSEAVDAHWAWWDQVVKHRIDQSKALTMTTEFGPPHYLAIVTYTQQPLADQWDINTHMLQKWRERYTPTKG